MCFFFNDSANTEIYTSIPLHQKILAHPDFIAGKLDTGFLPRIGITGDKK